MDERSRGDQNRCLGPRFGMEGGEAGEVKKEGEGVETLKRTGWSSALAFFHGMELEDMKRTLGSACASWELEDFEDLRREAKKQRLALDLEENAALKNPVAAQKDASWIPRTGHADLSRRTEGIELVKARVMLPRMIWPNRLARRLGHAKEDDQRARMEEDERTRQINRLVDLLKKAGLIEGRAEKEGLSNAWLTRRRAMGRRANTLRAHVRLGEKMREFNGGSLGQKWFEDVSQVMDYIAGRLEEPCGKSIPASIFAALKFIEASAELPMVKRLSEDPILINFMAEISKSGWWVSRIRTSANRLVLGIILCWEFQVVELSVPGYIRLYAWFKLVKLWSMMRWSDTQGVPPARMLWSKEFGLIGDIVRSKTTGAGRRVEVQQFYVSNGAFLLGPHWLEVGFELFEKFGKEAKNDRRDFMMPRPNKALDGFRGSMVGYSDAMSMSRALLRELKAPMKEGGAMEELVIEDEVGGFWSEHSERVTMASWSGALGIKQEVIKRWGRWKPSVDEEYVKTTKLLVGKAQDEVANRIKAELGKDLVGDEDVLQSLEKRLRERSVPEDKIRRQMKRLRFPQKLRREAMPGSVDLMKPGGKADEEVTSPADSVREELDLEELEVNLPDTTLEIGVGTYVLSVVGRSKKRTLHQVGGCYRIPGVDYRDYVVVGDVRPELCTGERLCGTCFGRADKIVSEAEMVPSDESSSTELMTSDPDESDSS